MSLTESHAAPSLPMEGALPPDLEGTFFRVGPATRSGAPSPGAARGVRVEGETGPEGTAPGPATGEETGAPPVSRRGSSTGTTTGARGALHAVELREGRAVSYLRRESDADAGLLWHAGSLLALPESGLPSQYSRFLEAEEFSGGLTVPIASHVRRVASDDGRVLFAVDDGSATAGGELREAEGTFLRIGEWDARGALRTAQSVELERATWQHDIGVTERHVVFVESPTARLTTGPGATSPVPFGWVPGAESWLGLVGRGGDGTDVRWVRLDPCVVTHVLGAWEEDGDAGENEKSTIVLFVCRYEAPEQGRPVDLTASVVGPSGVGLSPIGGNLAVLERWRVAGDAFERSQVDERHVEYMRMDALCEGVAFRYGYGVEMAWAESADVAPRTNGSATGRAAMPVGLLKFDLRHDGAASWSPGPGLVPSEPVFVRSTEGHGDDEGWLLALVDDEDRGATDLYVFDASALGGRRTHPEAVVHLPERLPLRSHGEWVPADRYR